jgi:hypothetical protein
MAHKQEWRRCLGVGVVKPHGMGAKVPGGTMVVREVEVLRGRWVVACLMNMEVRRGGESAPPLRSWDCAHGVQSVHVQCREGSPFPVDATGNRALCVSRLYSRGFPEYFIHISITTPVVSALKNYYI